MNPLDWRIIDGPGLIVISALGVLALCWLVLGDRRHQRRGVVPAVVVAGVVALASWFLLERALVVWDAPQPRWFYVLAGIAAAGIVLAVIKFLGVRAWWRRVLTVVAPVLIVVAVAVGINAHFGSYPTLRAALGGSDIPELEVADISEDGGPVTTFEEWTPPQDMPSQGMLRTTEIPGTVSGVQAGPAYVYLPPAYLASTPAVVPVLVLVHGDPGGPKDWITGGELPALLDEYAAAHKGLAPIVVLPDASASTGPTPSLCLDSNYGNAGTYLSNDIHAWVRDTLHAGTHAASDWAIGGFSYGGTCALTMAMGHPDEYPTFLDISGEDEPTISAGQDALIANYFSGDTAAFAAQNPLDLVRTRSYPDTAGIVTVGADDSFYAPQGRTVADALKQAGVSVQLQTVSGGHTWQAWRAGLQNNMDWLMQRFGVLPG